MLKPKPKTLSPKEGHGMVLPGFPPRGALQGFHAVAFRDAGLGFEFWDCGTWLFSGLRIQGW